MKKIVLIGALPDSLTNFRGELLKEFVNTGAEVYAFAASATEEQSMKIKNMGVAFVEFPVQRNGLNPFKDLKTYWVLRNKLKEINPDVVLAYTIKPIIWGGLALAGNKTAKFYALVTGLGFAFQGESLKRRLLTKAVSLLYKASLARAAGVIFQNGDDLNVFSSRGIVSEKKCHIVNGSGVDTSHFSPQESQEKSPTFITVARLLVEKGLRIYAEAARKVKQKYPDAVFRLLGSPDPSPDGIPMSEVLQWQNDNIVEYLGETNDVRPHLASCHIFVLASYYGEGLPRTIIEAMAVGKPILTTDNVGCRETVTNGQNGFLVPIKNADVLAEKMIWYIEHKHEWKRMGDASREMAVELFDVNKVNSQMFKIMEIST